MRLSPLPLLLAAACAGEGLSESPDPQAETDDSPSVAAPPRNDGQVPEDPTPVPTPRAPDAPPPLDPPAQDPPTAAACPAPHLFVAVEELSQTAPSGGVIAQFSLAADGITRCEDLDGGGLVGDQPLALTWVSPTRLAVATRDETLLLNITADSIVWLKSFTSSHVPMDAVTIEHADGPLLGVGELSKTSSGGDIGFVEFRRLSDGSLLEDFFKGPFSLKSISRDPRDPRKLLLARDATQAAIGAIPLENETDEKPWFSSSGVVIRSVFASRDGARVVWSATKEQKGVILFANNPDKAAFELTPTGPIDPCPERSCRFEHAVPDVTNAHRWFVLCHDAGQSSVLRIDTESGTCESILASDDFKGHRRLSRMAISPAP